MKRILALVVLLHAIGSTQVDAGRIERACKASDSKAASSTLCRCIQRAANSKLTFADRRLVAKFFKKPDLAQKTRQSDDPRKERFWKRYTSFSGYAAKVCS